MVELSAPGGRLLVELRSRETLTSWAITCLAERLVRRLHPQLEDYELALCFHDLRLLSLSDCHAHGAFDAVTAYLRRRTSNGGMGRPVFSHRSSDATASFAEKVGRASPIITAAWRTEQANAAGRVQVHWDEVQRKQALARQLRARLATERIEMHSAQSQRNAAPYASSPSQYTSVANDSQWYENQRLDAVLQSRCSTVASTEAALKAAEAAPEPVIQPLPADDASAYAVLCFMYMPPPLRSLANLSFVAQLAFAPCPLAQADSATLHLGGGCFDWVRHHAAC